MLTLTMTYTLLLYMQGRQTLISLLDYTFSPSLELESRFVLGNYSIHNTFPSQFQRQTRELISLDGPFESFVRGVYPRAPRTNIFLTQKLQQISLPSIHETCLSLVHTPSILTVLCVYTARVSWALFHDWGMCLQDNTT